MDVLESEYLLQARLANTIAFAALHGNPAADVDKGAHQMGQMYVQALDAVPYLTVTREDDADSVQDERDQAVRRWKKMQAQESET